MGKKLGTTLFIFRRDLRIDDNIGLNFALENSTVVIPCFIFTPEQIEKNSYRSDHCLKFMIECLQDLSDQLQKRGGQLYLFQGSPAEIVQKCITEEKVTSIVVNRDYTPYSIQRDREIENIAKRNEVYFFSLDDCLLCRPEDTLKKDGRPYLVFTPFFQSLSRVKVPKPKSSRKKNYFTGTISFATKDAIFARLLQKYSIQNSLVGSRGECIKILKKIKEFNQYSELRNFPIKDYSTHLSPYLKFTVCSPREIYWVIYTNLGRDHPLIRALYWREFFTIIAFFFPHVLKGAFHKKWDRLKWSYDKTRFTKWKSGNTGFPIVDAGMRELNKTGFIPNRIRMITASFLVKDLHIDWRKGEKYFAQRLVDYDPCVNNGNWQWIAGTGSAIQPYFQIFNPWVQQKKFDPECQYIKKWIPELTEASATSVHNWYDKKYRDRNCKYPIPIIDHEKTSAKTVAMYRSIR